MKRLSLYVGFIAVMLAGCETDPEFTDPVEAGNEDTGISSTLEEFVYASDQAGKFDIWHKHEATETKITQLDGDSWWPRMSNDGNTVLFYHSDVQVLDVNDYHTAGLWRMDINGENLKEIVPQQTNGWEQHGFANWSPDDAQIVFCAVDAESKTWQIFVADSDGGNAKRVSQNIGQNYFDPVFSPNGGTIACVREPVVGQIPDQSNYEIFLIDLESETETQLTDNAARDHHPDFSADGSRIVFEQLTDVDYLGIGNWSLKMIDIASKEESSILDDDHIAIFPRFGKNDEAIFFNQVNTVTFKLRVARLNVASGEITYLTDADFNAMNIDPY